MAKIIFIVFLVMALVYIFKPLLRRRAMKKKNKKIEKGGKVFTPYGPGVVIAIDPDGVMPFLVEIEGWNEGHAATYWWDKWWYPAKYKTPSRKRQWFEKEKLEMIV